MDLYRKRTSDYSDYAYREAVSKLKYLLAESYTPVNVHKYSPASKAPYLSSCDHADGIDSYAHKSSTACKRPELTTAPTPELASYIKKQEDYITHLEKESQLSRDEVSKMLERVKDVIAENERLRIGPLKVGIESEEESEYDDKEIKKKYCKHIVAPNIVFESRISELEAQLTQSKIELRKALEEANYQKSKLIECPVPHNPQETNKQLESLQRERDELNNTICNLQSLVSQLKEKESAATQKVKRSLDLVDQAYFDKNQLELEIRRLKSELERMNDKQREAIQDTARRVSEAERRYAMQIERLNGDLATQWDAANRLNLELDRSRRTEQELRRELAQKISVIEELKKDLTTKTSNLQTEALTAGAERENLESELANSRMAIERAERNGRQETARLQAEVASLRQRLDRADSDLLHTRKENLRLTDTISSLEKELELANVAKNNSKDPKKNDDLTYMIKEMDAKHAQSVTELEGMIQSQTQLMEKLKNECQTLTERLEDSSARHKEEMAGLQSNIEYLNSKLEAPVNYENQEWRDDGMVNSYPEEQAHYDEVNNKLGEVVNKDGSHYEATAANYEPGNMIGYGQDEPYHEQSGYEGDQVYPGQGEIYQEGEMYQDGNVYQEGEAFQEGDYQDGNTYPESNVYQDGNAYVEGDYQNDAYPQGETPYTENVNYPQEQYPADVPYGADQNAYIADPKGYTEPETKTYTEPEPPKVYQEEAVKQPTNTSNVKPTQNSKPTTNVKPSPNSKPAPKNNSKTESNERTPEPGKRRPSTKQGKDGADNKGGRVVGQPEAYIPKTGR